MDIGEREWEEEIFIGVKGEDGGGDIEVTFWAFRDEGQIIGRRDGGDKEIGGWDNF